MPLTEPPTVGNVLFHANNKKFLTLFKLSEGSRTPTTALPGWNGTTGIAFDQFLLTSEFIFTVQYNF